MQKKEDYVEKVEKLIKHYGSDSEAARQLGVSYMTVYRWKEGKAKPSRMAQILIDLLLKKK